VLERNGYQDVEEREFCVNREWAADGVAGYVLSLSFASPEMLRPDREAFEADLRERLAATDPPFTERVSADMVSGRVGEE
jgi:hypothetical protein